MNAGEVEGGLLDRAAAVEAQMSRIDVRRQAASEESALTDAFEVFEEQRDRLLPLVEQVRGMREHDLEVDTPNPSKAIQGVERLADAIEADPTAVRDRGPQRKQLESIVNTLQTQVSATVRERMRAAKGDAGNSLVKLLGLVGLDEPAERLDAALGTLDEFAGNAPRSAADWQRVDDAAEAIANAVPESGGPLLEFMRSVLGGGVTLEDLDPDLLAELKQRGAAKNLAIRINDR
ncbi:MAG TPA: hypothetical protein VJ204_02250 [Solirubrobacterales bacterium]|nr:hypothetical protein [Solirubrobacterales bacterium]